MIHVENIQVFNFEGAFRGLRNPMNSWHLSDSEFDHISNSDCSEYLESFIDNNCNVKTEEEYEKLVEYYTSEGFSSYLPCGEHCGTVALIGPKDLNLAQRMIKAGSDERKFMRQIFVSMDITASFYYWKEFDTYKVGTVANSCSTMHKIHAKEFTLDDFSHEHLSDVSLKHLQNLIKCMNDYREEFVKDKEKHNWWQMIQLLPSSYNQKRTVTLNYENLRNMYFARKSHKLDEWRIFCNIIKTLPYGEELICYTGKED